MFDYLILNCIHRFKGERTVSGIYNLLTGKRSSQTMQDAKGYQVHGYFGIYPNLTRAQLESHIDDLEGKGLISVKKSFPFLTSLGKDHLSSYKGPTLQYFQGMVWHDVIPIYEDRIHLLVQTMANSKAGILNYVPIVEDADVQRWVKAVFRNFHEKLPVLFETLYEEIYHLLKLHSRLEAELLTHRLTGGGMIGMTTAQLREDYDLRHEDVVILLHHTMYYLFIKSKENKKDFPVLHLCTKGLDAAHLITQSARKTFQYIQQGLTMEEIITVRNLKKSTIQDHIVEAALVIPGFSIDSFLSEKDVKDIKEMAVTLDTQRLKQIHEAFSGKYDYFELRLALASSPYEEGKGKAEYEN
ncbi:Uncharacterized protein YpbB [Halobacillus dabanensis]|uniref:Uncharacterized protein YpbB n=1 Tax=Halobacillus dabanensis TaxID=240302 RepID=A0A1I3W2H3_HALDA|nr:helix-turn-helix domain-containing protein [Halobacillus dabanensis]SFK01383.1 Uncharacterized protein YpbB [Halobacillus dabanensis]